MPAGMHPHCERKCPHRPKQATTAQCPAQCPNGHPGMQLRTPCPVFHGCPRLALEPATAPHAGVPKHRRPSAHLGHRKFLGMGQRTARTHSHPRLETPHGVKSEYRENQPPSKKTKPSQNPAPPPAATPPGLRSTPAAVSGARMAMHAADPGSPTTGRCAQNACCNTRP